MAKSVIGESISATTAGQLKIRRDALANKGTEPDWQKLYTSKTAWVKLSSSVNIEGSNQEAKSNVLTGNQIEGNSSINRGYNDSVLGTRPIPGITNVSIQAINRFGTLRNAVVEFKVYDVERLSQLEALYMRPGFSILLEWGHTAYKTSKGVSTNINSYKGFFQESNAKTVENGLQRIEKATEGNYGGLFGYIKNFQWSFNIDGSYNCSVEIISKGELLESLQYAIYTVDETRKEDEENLDKEKSPLHRVLYGIKEEGQTGDSTKKIEATLFTRIGNILSDGIRHVGPIQGNDESQDKDQTLSYIRFTSLLLLINKLVSLKDQNGTPLSLFRPDVVSRYVTYDLHFSGDPGVVMLPKKTDAYPGFSDAFTHTKSAEGAIIPPPRFTGPENVHELWLNVDFVLRELDSAIDSRTNTASAFDFLQNLLAGIEGALGGINEFDIGYNQDDDYHYILDRRYFNPLTKREKIKVSGKDSIVSNVSIVSKLSPKLGSLIAISAQANRNVIDVGIEAENLFKWNEGLKDRIITQRILPNAVSANDEEEGIPNEESQYTKDRKRVIKVLKELAENKVYTPAKFIAIRSSHQYVTKAILRARVLANKKAPQPGIIPFELSLTMDGITGFKIGQTFEIEDDYIFPSRYRNAIAFIITGLEHSIQGNRWTTTIKAQTITK